MSAVTRHVGAELELEHSLHGSLRDGYPSAVQVLLQTRVELRQPPQLQLSHALLLALAITDVAGFVRGRHYEVARGVVEGISTSAAATVRAFWNEVFT